MIQDTIKYNGKEYQISTTCIGSMYTYETMIFPMAYGLISGKDIYCFRTNDEFEARNKHKDIYHHPEKYLTEESINKYLKSKEELFMSREKFKEEEFTKDELALLKLAFKIVDDVVEIQRTSNSDVYTCNELYSLKQKLGINELVG